AGACCRLTSAARRRGGSASSRWSGGRGRLARGACATSTRPGLGSRGGGAAGGGLGRRGGGGGFGSPPAQLGAVALHDAVDRRLADPELLADIRHWCF